MNRIKFWLLRRWLSDTSLTLINKIVTEKKLNIGDLENDMTGVTTLLFTSHSKKVAEIECENTIYRFLSICDNTNNTEFEKSGKKKTSEMMK